MFLRKSIAHGCFPAGMPACFVRRAKTSTRHFGYATTVPIFAQRFRIGRIVPLYPFERFVNSAKRLPPKEEASLPTSTVCSIASSRDLQNSHILFRVSHQSIVFLSYPNRIRNLSTLTMLPISLMKRQNHSSAF